VYVVTNLNDSGAGSFRDAVSQSNRIIVFAVGGYDHIASPISAASNLTILGQTAPGGGFGVYGAEVSFYGSGNDIVQYMRFRDTTLDPKGQGTGNSSGNDVNLGNTNNMIFDHDSLEFASYNNVDASGTTGANNLSFQNSIIADPIPDQQFNFHWQGNQGTFINNIFANSHNRSILSKGNVQFVNNSIYNYQAAFTTGNSSGKFNFDIVNNYFVAGPSTSSAGDDFYQVDTNQTAYATGNLLDGSANGTLSGSADNSTGANVSATPLLASTTSLPTLSATASYAFNLAHSGDSITHNTTTYASSLGLDQVDTVTTGDVGSYGTSGRLYNTQNDTGLSNGGLGTIASGSIPTSTANDGLPDSWKVIHGLSTTVADSTLLNPVGYTMIEQYAAEISDEYLSRTWSATSGNWVSNAGNWSTISPGVYDHALVRGSGTTDGSVTVSGTNSVSAYSLSIGGNGPAAGESVLVSGGLLNIYNGIVVGDQNNAALQITGGAVVANTVQLGNTVYTANGSSSTTYTGTLNLLGGVLSTSVVGNGGGTPGNWNSGGFINWSGGTLAIDGTLSVTAPATLGAGGGILNTNSGSGTISGVISGSGPFLINGGGSIALTGLNTFTGITTIRGATLTIPALANGGAPSELGATSNAASNIVLDGGTLAGSGNTDRLFTLTTNGGTLDNSGGNNYTNTGAIALPTGNVTLTLTGTNTGHETFSPTLADPGGGFVTSVSKTGTGKWTFNITGDKTYSGDTTVSAGTLETLATNALSPNSNLNLAAGAFLEMHGYNSAINALEGAGTVTDSFNHAGDTFTIGANNGSGTFTGNLGNGSLPNVIKNGTGTQVLGSTDTYTGTTTINGGVLQFNLAVSIGGTGVSVTLNNGAAAAAGYAMDQAFLGRITSGSSGSAAVAIASANNLDFSSGTGANLPNVSLGAVGTVSYTGTITPYATTYLLGGGGGTLVLPNVQLTGSDAVTVVGPGIVSSTGADTYTGLTTIRSGGVFAPAVVNGGLASGMGESSNAAANLILDGGTFQGAGSTDRSFTLTTNGGSVDNSRGLNLTGPGAVVVPANVNSVLKLTGTSTGHNQFNLSLADPGNGFTTSVTKTGTGKWTFSAPGTKTYSGPTTIVSGQLEALADDSFSHYSDMIISSGASLEMHSNSVTINGLSGTGAVYNTFVSGTKTLTIGAQNDGGVWAGNINSGATLNVYKSGTGVESFTAANSYVGSTTVVGGTLILSTTGSIISSAVYVNAGATFDWNGSIPSTATLTDSGTTVIGANPGSGIDTLTLAGLSISSPGQVQLLDPAAHSSRTLFVVGGLTLGGASGSWQGQLDLGGNDLIVNGGSVSTLTNQLKQGFNLGRWNGSSGIVSSTAAGNASHLTALGVIQNSVDGKTTGAALYGSGTTLGLFDGYSPLSSDVLVKYTYYGDTNLDGMVDGTDYSRIDNGYAKGLSGWYNGDFNYDGVVDGSDYTLIDNAYNAQGVRLTDQLADPGAISTAQVAAAAPVPEPTCLAAGAMLGLALLGRRRRV
jgi:autotransporter-associated beta strand protein